MLPWKLSWNAGTLLAAALLLVGGALLLAAPEDRPGLRTAGLGIVILAGAVHLVSRIVMLVKERRS
jgi:hypothetical protein